MPMRFPPSADLTFDDVNCDRNSYMYFLNAGVDGIGTNSLIPLLGYMYLQLCLLGVWR